MEKISLSLPKKTLEEIDARRKTVSGTISRSAYIRRIVVDQMEAKQ